MVMFVLFWALSDQIVENKCKVMKNGENEKEDEIRHDSGTRRAFIAVIANPCS